MIKFKQSQTIKSRSTVSFLSKIWLLKDAQSMEWPWSTMKDQERPRMTTNGHEAMNDHKWPQMTYTMC